MSIQNFYYKIYNFIVWKNVVLLVSVCLILISCILIIIKGFNFGLDFTGGIFVEITVEDEIDVMTVRDFFVQSGFTKVIVQSLGMYNDFIIKLPVINKNDNFFTDSNINMKVLNILHKNMTQKFVITQINWMSPTVNINLIKNGIIALLIAAICIFMYISFRFTWRLAVGVIISLIHDTIIIIGILSLFFVEIDSTVIAALMSAIGYSLNDKIVIFDRIRENFYSMSKLNTVQIFNLSISQVLHRTIITSVTTVAVLLVLLIFGGSILYGFSVILLTGVIIGTLSSIYVGSILAFKFGTKREHFIKE